MDEFKALYLRLSPEFGERRFGPYEQGEVRIGSDMQSCAIHIGNLGALPIHAKIFLQNDNELILSPSERSAEIFIWRRNRNPERIMGATIIKPGDAFSIVQETGVKFIVEWDDLPKELQEQREKEASRAGVGRSRLSADSMKTEVKRQAFSQLLVFGPMQLLQRAMTFIKSGAIYQPRNIIAGTVLLSGWILGGSMSCRKRSLQTSYNNQSTVLNTCNQNLDYYKDLTTTENFTLTKAIGEITKSPQLAQLLKKDKKLMQLVKDKSLSLSDQPSPKWLNSDKDTAYSREMKKWISAIRSAKETEIDLETQKLLIWLMTHEDKSNKEFIRIPNVNDEKVCGRGILNLTYRQGVHLNLTVQPDAPYKGNAAKLSQEAKVSKLKQTIEETLGNADENENVQELINSLNNQETNVEQLENNAAVQYYCIYAEGEDDRKEFNTLKQRLKEQVGVGIKNLPKEDDALASASRIAKIFLADLEEGDFRKENDLTFSSTLSSSLDRYDAEGSKVLESTAEVIARSIVFPCKTQLKGSDNAKLLLGGEEGEFLPEPIPCLVFDWKIRNE